MKFGQYLQQHLFLPWRNEYIQYDHMKNFLKNQQLTEGGWTQKDEVYFTDTLMVTELDKVNEFIRLKIKQTRSIIHQESKPNLIKKVNDLIKFIELNAAGFQKILKKHDKWTGISLQYCLRFRGIQPQFEVSIQQLNEIINSDRIDVLRKINDKNQAIRTTKYWIHPDNLTEVQAILLFHLVPQQQPSNSSASEKNMINTIYFDNPVQFSLYSELLERKESAETIQARWYGLGSNTSTVSIERKTHHESLLHTKGLHVKEQFDLPMHQVNDYISSGTYFAQHNLALAANIYDKIRKNELKPILRSHHLRTTYQEGPDLLISLDTNVTFKKEIDPLTWRRNDNGDSYSFDQLHSDEAYVFPYAILETKLMPGNDTVRDWLTSLEESQLVYEIPYFSMYLHGASHFFQASFPKLPWWLGVSDVDIRRKRIHSTMINQSPAKFAEQQRRCTILEPALLPDYFHIVPTEQRLSKGDENNEKLDDHTSSYTLIESDIGLLNKYTTRSITKRSAHDNSFDSNIVTKIKYMYYEMTKREENHVSMASWLYAKITNNKTILLSSSEPTLGNHQQIRPKQWKLKRKVEPKVFFANERTFISWLQFSALLLSVSLGLINFGDHVSKASGAFFILIAVALAVYAQLRFQYRAWQIRFRSESRFDDIYGPAVLCLVLIIALIVNLGLRVNQPLPTNPSLFSYNETSKSDDLSSTVVSNSTTPQQIVTNHHFPNGTRLDKHGQIVHDEEEEDENEPDEA